MKIGLTFPAVSPQEAASRYIVLLAAELSEAKPSSMHVDGNRIALRGGFFRFVSNWNLLVPITSAEISVDAQTDSITVSLRARLTQLVVFCAIATAFFLYSTQHWPSPIHWFGVLALVWGWLFGMNVVLTRLRLVGLLRRIARATISDS